VTSKETGGERVARALCSLEGLSVGDAFGQQYFMTWEMAAHYIESDTVPGPPYDFTDDFIARLISEHRLPYLSQWQYTDDTEMALSVVATLRQHGSVAPDELARSFGLHFDRSRGYGEAMHALMPRLAAGEPWRSRAQELFGGQGSFGNGAAMRVAPVGGYFADDLKAVAQNARRSAEVTHSHPEAAAGAIAVAVAAAWAWRLRTVTVPCPEFLDRVLPWIPDSEVRKRVIVARDLPSSTSVGQAVGALGNGEDVSAQDTVPFALWCAGRHLEDYESALWLTVSGLGDRDTTCAIVGGIVALSAGMDSIPAKWRMSREPLPAWFIVKTG
jgi:ADP-ribosylglycohydrolase